MEILYEDDAVVVCVKPCGVLSERGTKGEANMLSLLETAVGGDFYPVHRLDRDVGGVMVYARNAASASELSSMIGDHELFRKEYLAVAKGKIEEKEGVFTDLLFHDARKNKTYVVSRKRNGVKEAELAFRVLGQAGEGKDARTLVSVRLFTGRSHQIRVQFASRGFPLVGDRKYGGCADSAGIALFAAGLSFPHPGSGKIMTFRAEPETGTDGAFGAFRKEIRNGQI